MVVNEILRRSCRGVRMVVESVSGWLWNECPDQPGITVRMLVEWVSEWARNPQKGHSSEKQSVTTILMLLAVRFWPFSAGYHRQLRDRQKSTQSCR